MSDVFEAAQELGTCISDLADRLPSLRERAAVAALQGLLAHQGSGLYNAAPTLQKAAADAAAQAVAFADALVAQLDKEAP